jgi:hypothetical protein
LKQNLEQNFNNYKTNQKKETHHELECTLSWNSFSRPSKNGATKLGLNLDGMTA